MSSCELPLACFPLNDASSSAYYIADSFRQAASDVKFELATDIPVPDSVATFAGSETQSITFGKDCSMLPTEQITVTLWVKLQELGKFGQQYFFIGCFGDTTGFYLGTTPGNSLAFILASAQSLSPTLIADPAQVIDPNKWYHMAAAYDGSVMSLYVNGKLVRASTAQNGLIKYPTKDAAFKLGAYQDSSTKMYFKGHCISPSAFYF
jgi:hypothetical protein